jgi:hypothetical protein
MNKMKTAINSVNYRLDQMKRIYKLKDRSEEKKRMKRNKASQRSIGHFLTVLRFSERELKKNEQLI